jgi:hypothetical protein
MLTLQGRPFPGPSFCDRLRRRNFLKIGTLGIGGLTLPQLLRGEAAAGVGHSIKSVIMIYLVGGPPHQDMFDLKPLAPKEVAGPWRPIATNVPGFEVCEAFPRLARMADKSPSSARSSEISPITTPSRSSTAIIRARPLRREVGRSSAQP